MRYMVIQLQAFNKYFTPSLKVQLGCWFKTVCRKKVTTLKARQKLIIDKPMVVLPVLLQWFPEIH